MKKLLLVALNISIVFMLLAGIALPSQHALAAGTVGTGTPASCTESAFDTALAGGGLITFNCGASPLVLVFTSQKIIGSDTTIDGGNKISLSGGNTTRLFSVSSGVHLTLKDLTLIHGSSAIGGAIYNAGVLTITGSYLINNDSPSSQGGAIYNDSLLTIRDSYLLGNIAGGGIAGGIQNNGTLTVTNTTFSDNFGGVAAGAIDNSGSMILDHVIFDKNQSIGGGGAIDSSGPVTISNSTFQYNKSSSQGGAIYNGSAMTITLSTLISNTASTTGGGIYSGGATNLNISSSSLISNTAHGGGGVFIEFSGELLLTGSTLKNNTTQGSLGGGVYSNGTVTIDRSTITGNQAIGGIGGGLDNDNSGIAVIENSTFSDNFAGVSAGGINNLGTLSLLNVTLANNINSGLVNGVSSAVVKNTIIANNTPPNCIGTITSVGHNLESANSCAFASAGDLINSDPLLGPLANNFGPTFTYALLPGSPAINAGTNSGCPPTDQRGVPRPQYGTCDIGAFEFVKPVYLPQVLRH